MNEYKQRFPMEEHQASDLDFNIVFAFVPWPQCEVGGPQQSSDPW